MHLLYYRNYFHAILIVTIYYSVLIGSNQEVKISDFGTCLEWNDVSTRMSFAGTLAWMAPEVIRNEPCNEKVDIWYVIKLVMQW